MINRKEFVETYIPMAKAGKSALEIGQALGLDGDEKKVSQKVSQQAGLYRKELKKEALALAAERKLDKQATATLVEQASNIMPKLSKRRRESGSELSSFLRDLIDKADSPE